MLISKNIQKFNNFTSYSLVIDRVKTNQWYQSEHELDQFINAVKNSPELQVIIADSIITYNHFDICTFIPLSLLSDLPIKIFFFDDISKYWEWEKETYGHWAENRKSEIFSVSGKPTEKELFTEKFAKKELFDSEINKHTQLNRLYNSKGERAKEIHLVVFNYGYHFATMFN